MKPYIVGICGGSGSGKTFLLNKLLEYLPLEHISLISQDNYYKKFEEHPKDEDGLVNFDHPNALNLDAFVWDMEKLTNGESISVQEYTFNNPDISPRTLHYSPTPIIILEGLFIFHKKELYRLIDLKLFVDTDEHLRLTRRLVRDYKERTYSYQATLRDYNKFVAPMFQKYVAPAKRMCDIIIPNNTYQEKTIKVLANHLKAMIERETIKPLYRSHAFSS